MMEPTLVYALAVLALALALLWLGTSTFGGLSSLPGPRPLPFIGNLHFLLSLPPDEANASLSRRYGGVVRYFVGRKPFVLVSGPDELHEVTVTAADKFRNRIQHAGRAHSMGLLTARDDYWKQLRRIITPTFNVIHLKHMLPPMHEEIKVIMSQLEEACVTKREVDIHAMFTRLTLDIIGRVAFGTKLEAQLGAKSQLLDASAKLLRDVPRNNGLFAMLFPELWELKQKIWPSGLRAQVLEAGKVMNSTLVSLLRKRKAEREQEWQDTDQRVPNDFLDLLLDARDKATGKALTEQEICDQAMTFLLAGHETTANTLASTVLLLSQNPDVDEVAYSELMNVLPASGDLDLNHLSTLPKLTMILKESLRIYPPATNAARDCNEDAVIGGKYFIPKGTSVVFPIKVLNNNPELWPEPEKFLPFERWGNESDSDKKNALIWLPFGAGPRNCIGMRFAMVEAKLVLAHVLRRFRFHLSPGQLPLELQPGITTSPKHGIKVTVHRR